MVNVPIRWKPVTRRRVLPMAALLVGAAFTRLPAGDGVAVPAIAVTAVQFNANDLAAGQSVTGTVVLDQAAPPTRGGVEVQLVSSSGLVQVPSTVMIPHGTRSASFAIRTSFGRLGCATVTARSGTSSASNVLYITSASAFDRGTPAVTLNLSTSQTVGGTTVQGTVELPAVTKQPVDVALGTSDASIAAMPSSVTIPAGQRRVTVPIRTNGVGGNTCVEVSARADGTTSRRLLKVAGISG